jgi:hypothetical protein
LTPRFFRGPVRWLAPDSGLSKTQRLVLMVLCIWTDRSTGECYPRVETVAAYAGLCERTVRTALAALARAGAITIVRRRTEEGLSISSIYTVKGFEAPAGEFAQTGGPDAGMQLLQGGLQETASRGANDRRRGVHQLPSNVVKENKAVKPTQSTNAAVKHRGVDDWVPSQHDLDEARALPKGSAIAEARQMIENGIRPDRVRSTA